MKQCFAPVSAPDATILVLGSLPGEESLARQQYYAHPRNAFWRLIGDVLGVALVDLAYDARLECLRDRGIALWDVVGRANRRTSLDQHLRDVEPNPLAQLIETLPELRIVAFNGQTAAAIGRPLLPPGQPHIVLPSSSPAHTLALASKQEAWVKLRPFLR